MIRSEQVDEEGWLLEVDLPYVEAERLAAGEDGAPLRALLPDRREDWET